jgi:hypothetical protein
MQLNKAIPFVVFLLALFSVNMSAFAADAGAKKSGLYTEDEFLNNFSGKSRKVISEKLGQPIKKEQSVKPTGANEVLAGKGEESSKPVNVEMWYYKGIVSYAPNKAYKSTELTFVNDRCMNIAFFNNK